MHFELCTFRDMTWHKKKWHKKVLILGLKFNWIHDSQSNCFIVSSPICAMRPIFFSLEFLTRLSFSTFFESFVFCFVLLFFFSLDYFDDFKDDFFLRWLHHYEIETSLPPQSPLPSARFPPSPGSGYQRLVIEPTPPPPISLPPNLLPLGLFRRLPVYTGRWNPGNQ